MKFIKSVTFALKGIGIFIKNESNAKYQLTVAILYSGIALYLGYNLIEWCIVLICFGAVLGAEAMNTAIEELVNHVSPNMHPQAGKVKDIAAGAVLIVAIFAGIVGVLLVVNKLGVL